MKKSSFIALLLGTVSAMFFALGMCMALIPEWNAFRPGVIFGCVGLVLALMTVLVWRKMEGKAPVHLSGKAGSGRRPGPGGGHVLLHGLGPDGARHPHRHGGHRRAPLPHPADPGHPGLR